MTEMPLPKINFRNRPNTHTTLGKLGRVQLSRYFFMREFLYSEIGAVEGLDNTPRDPALAIRTGRMLALTLLDPLVETFGPIAVRSAYRSPEVNGFGAEHGLNCGSNENNYAAHIWDIADAEGNAGAMASVVIPWFARRYEQGRDFRDLAWWLYDHLPFHSLTFFPARAAFNFGWRENPTPAIRTWIGDQRVILRRGAEPDEDAATRAARYSDFPPFRGIQYPE